MASPSLEMHDLILARLKAFPAVAAIVGDRVYDQAPEDAAYPHITFGPSDVVPDDADCITAREETVQMDIWHRDQGRVWPCKVTADAVKAALHGYVADLATHGLAETRVVLVRIMEDPDGVTVHGVVQVTATVEEF